MIRSDLMTLASELATLSSRDLGSIKGSYAVAKNIKIIAEDVKTIEELKEKITKDFETARTAICELHAEKDENGTAKVENDNYVGLPNEAFNNDLQALIADHQPKIDEFNSFLKEEIDISLFKVGIEHFPASLTPMQVMTLMPIIAE